MAAGEDGRWGRKRSGIDNRYVTEYIPLMKYAKLPRRMAAYLIDALIVYLVFVVITQTFIFGPIRQMFSGSDQWFVSGWRTEVYTLLTISIPAWLYFGLCEISAWRATVGKRLLKLQTLDKKSQQGMVAVQAIIRTLIKMVPWEMAHLANNLPIPIWYDPDPGFRFGFMLVPLLLVIYIVLVLVTKSKQSVHDLVANTVVVYSP